MLEFYTDATVKMAPSELPKSELCVGEKGNICTVILERECVADLLRLEVAISRCYIADQQYNL